eukprot:2100946-Lingulodinium_polyedra.AAC.1
MPSRPWRGLARLARRGLLACENKPGAPPLLALAGPCAIRLGGPRPLQSWPRAAWRALALSLPAGLRGPGASLLIRPA